MENNKIKSKEWFKKAKNDEVSLDEIKENLKNAKELINLIKKDFKSK